jgi:hypothetical protein
MAQKKKKKKTKINHLCTRAILQVNAPLSTPLNKKVPMLLNPLAPELFFKFLHI